MAQVYISVKEAAKRLDVHKITLVRAIHAGKFQAIQIGNRYKVSEESLNQYIESLKVQMAQYEETEEE